MGAALRVKREIKATRKRRQCDGCEQEMPVHSSMLRITEAKGGRVKSTYWCVVCALRQGEVIGK